MCDGCRLVVCDPRCPLYSAQPRRVCEHCGLPIWEGEEYCELDDGIYCKDCLENMSMKNLLKLLDKELKTA